MNNNDLYRIGKIAISQKLPDRFLSVKVYSPKGAEKEYGSLYFLIEITTPWFPATEIGKAIERSVISNFYSVQNSKNTESRFEEALKKTKPIQLTPDDAQKANKFGLELVASEASLIISKLKQYWNPPEISENSGVKMRIFLSIDEQTGKILNYNMDFHILQFYIFL